MKSVRQFDAKDLHLLARIFKPNPEPEDQTFRAVVEFVKVVRAGKRPSRKTLEVVAGALGPLLTHTPTPREFRTAMEQFKRGLGLRQPEGRGRKDSPSVYVKDFERALAVAIEANGKKPDSETFETVAVELHPSVDGRTVRRAWRKLQPSVEIMIAARRVPGVGLEDLLTLCAAELKEQNKKILLALLEKYFARLDIK